MIAEFSVTPVFNSEDTADWVARAVEIIDKSGLNYQVTAMGTLIEGDFDDVMAVIKECHQNLMVDCPRIKTLIRIDDHKGRQALLQKRITEVEHLLGKELSH